MTAIDKREADLRARLATLEERLDTVEAELDEPHSKDWEEAATEAEGDEVLEDLGRASVAEIARIRAALDRIADGSYGVCAKCGDDIAEERLDLVPETPFCRNCAT